jgi:hypothetical protein
VRPTHPDNGPARVLVEAPPDGRVTIDGGPIFRWPEWLIRLSPFDAFGTPYINLPRTGGLALLVGLAIVGTATAALVGRWRSSLV